MIDPALQEAADNLELTVRKLIQTCVVSEEKYYQTLSCLKYCDTKLKELLDGI